DEHIKKRLEDALKSNSSIDMDGMADALDEKYGIQDKEGIEELSVADDSDEDSNEIIRLSREIIEDAYAQGASDIHVETFENHLLVRYRIDGMCKEVAKLPQKASKPLLSRFKIMGTLDIAERRRPQSGRIVFKEFTKKKNMNIDLRIEVAPMNHGEKACMRILDKSKSTLPLDKLGFSEANLLRYREVIKTPFGMLLHCGPTGSGKSMTLYSALGEVYNPSLNIHTAEDPIEYTLEGLNQMQMAPKAGLTFASALRSFLRMDPDIILVGEIRDKETADIAVEAALTGHLLFSTLHTNDAAGTIARFTEMDVEPFMISASLLTVCAQRLMRRICPKCRLEHEPNEREAVLLELDKFKVDTIYKANPKGCQKCNQIGYKGRVGTHELLVMNEPLRDAVNKGMNTDEVKRTAVEEAGMITLHKDSMEKVRQGITDLEEALRCVKPD
ncbi:GspE/PulE family protein, partial [Planctomycetota bacterium]